MKGGEGIFYGEVKKGYVTVYVGEKMTWFVIPIPYLKTNVHRI